MAIRMYPHIRQDYLGQVRCRVFTVFFLREEQFESNFREGLYIEDSLEFAYMPGIGIYYGYPREQMDLLKKNGFLLFSGVNPNCKKSILYVRLRCKLGSSRM